MKQRYEDRFAEIEEERDRAEQEQERLQLELNRAEDVGRRLQAQLSHTGVPASSAPQRDVNTEVLYVHVLSTCYSDALHTENS